MKQMQITLPENAMDVIRTKAEKCGITPNVHARIQLCQLNSPDEQNGSVKAYLIELENWREIEAYIGIRGFRDMGIFLNKTAEWYMKKYHLSAAQKTEAERNIEK